MAKKISVARDFTTTPGARFKRDGDFSGQEFREKYLEPLFAEHSNEKVIVDLDGVEGYSTAFLEEVFGGLVRIYGKEIVKNRINLISNEEPLLIEEINNYIEKAQK